MALSRKTLPWLGLSGLALVACASDPVAASDAEQTSAPAPPLGEPFATNFRTAIARDEARDLDAQIGAVVRGESPLYRGTFEAHDNNGVFASFSDGIIAPGAATALLETTPEGVDFTAYARRGTDWDQVVFHQAAGSHGTDTVTEVTGVETFASAGAPLGHCTGCIAPITGGPATIAFHELTAKGHYFDAASTTFVLTAQGTFTRVAANAITFADLATVRYVADYAASGADMVRRQTGLGANYQTGGDCNVRTAYAITRRIRTAKPSDHGVVDLVVDADSSRCCADVVDYACMPLAKASRVTTGTGNAATLALATTDVSFDPPGGAASPDAKYTMHLAYADAAAYFADAAAIRATAVVHAKRGGHEHVQTTTSSLTAHTVDGHTTYEADVAFTTDGSILEIELAFSDAAGHRWDSNLSRNYHVPIGELVRPSGPPG